MTFPPQCTKRWQLYEQMSRVLKMCEEAGFDRPWECVKFGSSTMFESLSGMMNGLVHFKPELVEFFLCFVEGRPVFRGDVLYGYRGEKFIVGDFCDEFLREVGYEKFGCGVRQFSSSCSWNPPQRTIEINGVKVKAPLSVEGSDDAEHPERHGVFITFKEYEDAEAFKAAMGGEK